MRVKIFVCLVTCCMSTLGFLRPPKPCQKPAQCLIFPCAPNVNPCSKDQICVPGCNCDATCVKKPKPPCQGVCDPKKCKSGRKCVTSYSYRRCTAKCIKCRRPRNCLVNPCLHTKCGIGQKCVADYCGNKCTSKCIASPEKPVCKSDGSSEGKICTQAITKFCTADCKCCENKNGCNPFPALYTKLERDCNSEVCPKIGCPLDVCKDHKCPAGNACVKKCCKPVCEPLLKPCRYLPCLKNPCAATTCPVGYTCKVNHCNGCSAQCVLVPKPAASPKCKSDGSSNGQICGAALTKFCSANCECCTHENTCNPFPSFYTKPATQCGNKECKNPVNCLVNPCETTKCPSGQKCVPNFCGGCNADCIPDPIKPATKPTQCPNRVNCKADPCSVMQEKCPVGQKCHANYCGGCNAECKPCKRPVNCLIDPCTFTSCIVGTKCVADYCNGCNAKCVALPTKPPTKTIPCPNIVECLVDPCMFKTCSLGQKCHSNYCGGCNAECKTCSKPDDCIAPCTRTLCPVGTTCVNDYCKGCNARCVPLPTTPSTQTTPCKDIRNCLTDPCQFKVCPTGQQCHSNFCGGCNAECKPLPKCDSDGSADGKICLQAIGTFCDQKCNCCIHKNLCNPFPSKYTKSSTQCPTGGATM